MKKQIGRATIEDLSTTQTLSDEQVQFASGGAASFGGGLGGGVIIIASYRAASCTVNCDTDWVRFD